MLNLQACSGCTLSEWGWTDGSYTQAQASTIIFSGSGAHTIRLQPRDDGVQFDQVVISPATYLTMSPGQTRADATIVSKPAAATGGPTPYSGTAINLPGILEIEDFDNGGEGIAYHDTTPVNSGGVSRQTGVDLEPASNGGYNVGWTAPCEWLLYSVKVAAAGSYLLEARVASEGAGGAFHVEFGGVNATGAMTIPNTNGWQIYTTVSKVVTLAAGSQFAKVVFDTDGSSGSGNIDWLRVSPVAASAAKPYSGTAIALPGTFAAEDFDAGGEGIAYHDTTSGNSGGIYRSSDVDIENCSLGGRNVGWTIAGEWLAYSVTVGTAGAYNVALKVASPYGTGKVHVTSGAAGTAVTSVPNSGGWQNWTTVVMPITLAAGPQSLKVMIDSGDFNIAGITVSPLVTVPAPTPRAPAWTGDSASASVSASASASAAPPPAPAPAGGKVTTVAAGADLQAAINNAQPGDTLMLAAGASYVGNFVLPVKSGSSYITIRSSAPDSSLPGDNTRITPAYASLLPKLRSPNSSPALATVAGAHHYRVQFVEFQANYQGFYDVIALGDGSWAQNSLSQVPHDLVIDRVYIHGDPTWGQKRGIGLNSASTSIVNSYISEIKAPGQDSQGIAGWNGPGPYLISNNYIEAAGENVLFGGSDPAIPSLVPSDITFTRNHLTKQLAWRSQTNLTVKNLFELKNAQRVVINGNIMENNWIAAQSGYAVLFTVRNQDGAAPWSVVQQVQFTNNIVRHSAAGINILGTDYINPSQMSNNIVIRNNLFEDISGAKYGGAGRFLLINGTPDVTIDHNTVIQDGWTAVYGDSKPSLRFVLSNNIIPDYSWALIGGGTAPGNGTIATYFPQGVVLNNIWAGSNASAYPTGNFYPASLASVGFVNLSGGDYRLSSSSIYRNAGLDGKDAGCDINALNAATAGVK